MSKVSPGVWPSGLPCHHLQMVTAILTETCFTDFNKSIVHDFDNVPILCLPDVVSRSTVGLNAALVSPTGLGMDGFVVPKHPVVKLSKRCQLPCHPTKWNSGKDLTPQQERIRSGWTAWSFNFLNFMPFHAMLISSISLSQQPWMELRTSRLFYLAKLWRNATLIRLASNPTLCNNCCTFPGGSSWYQFPKFQQGCNVLLSWCLEKFLHLFLEISHLGLWIKLE